MKPISVPVTDNHLTLEKIQQEEQHDEDQFREYTPNEMKSIKQRGYITLIGGVSLHLILGTFYLWGGISPYIGAYLKSTDESVTMSNISVVFPILGLIMNSVLSFGVKLAGKVGFKTMFFSGGFLISLAYFILSFVKNFIGFVIIFAVMIGISSGLVYMLPILCGWKFFPFHRAKVSGLIVAGYGFGAFIFNFVCQGYVNPNNEKPSVEYIEDGRVVKYFNSDVYEKVPNMFRILAGCYLGLTIIATLLTSFPTDINMEYQQVLRNSRKEEVGDHQKSIEAHPTLIKLKTECGTLQIIEKQFESFIIRRQGLMSIPYLLLMSMIIFSSLFGMLMANAYKLYGLHVNLNNVPRQQNRLTQMIRCQPSLVLYLQYQMAYRESYGQHQWKNTDSKPYISSQLDQTYFVQRQSAIQIVQEAELDILSSCQQPWAVREVSLLCSQPKPHKYLDTWQGDFVGPIIYGFLFFGIGLSNMFAYLLLKFALPQVEYQGLFWIFFSFNIIALLLGLVYKESHEWKKI